VKHFELFDFAPVFSLDANAPALPANENQPGIRLMRDILHCLLARCEGDAVDSLR
jgi:hypothetical protein